MSKSLLCFLAILLTVASISASQSDSFISDHVTDLTTALFNRLVLNLDTATLLNGPWFILFYLPECPHCHRVLPRWDRFAEEYGERINLGKVDCEDEASGEICDLYEIDGFPTMLLFKDGHIYHYTAERTPDGWGKFVFQKGYLNAKEKHEIPKRLEGLAHYHRKARKWMYFMAEVVEVIFERLGLEEMPVEVMYTIFGAFFILPIVFFFVIICCCITGSTEEHVHDKKCKHNKTT